MSSTQDDSIVGTVASHRTVFRVFVCLPARPAIVVCDDCGLTMIRSQVENFSMVNWRNIRRNGIWALFFSHLNMCMTHMYVACDENSHPLYDDISLSALDVYESVVCCRLSLLFKPSWGFFLLIYARPSAARPDHFNDSNKSDTTPHRRPIASSFASCIKKEANI